MFFKCPLGYIKEIHPCAVGESLILNGSVWGQKAQALEDE